MGRYRYVKTTKLHLLDIQAAFRDVVIHLINHRGPEVHRDAVMIAKIEIEVLRFGSLSFAWLERQCVNNSTVNR